MTTPGEPCRTCRGTGLIETAEQDSRVLTYEICRACDVVASAPSPSEQAMRGGGTLTDDSTLFDAVDSAAELLARVVSSLQSTGNAALYRSALEAHASTSMLRAQLRAYMRWAQEAEQARSMLQPQSS